jgi:hypothetical protein
VPLLVCAKPFEVLRGQGFRDLEKQWNELQKQLDELPKPPRKQ